MNLFCSKGNEFQGRKIKAANKAMSEAAFLIEQKGKEYLLGKNSNTNI